MVNQFCSLRVSIIMIAGVDRSGGEGWEGGRNITVKLFLTFVSFLKKKNVYGFRISL